MGGLEALVVVGVGSFASTKLLFQSVETSTTNRQVIKDLQMRSIIWT